MGTTASAHGRRRVRVRTMVRRLTPLLGALAIVVAGAAPALAAPPPNDNFASSHRILTVPFRQTIDTSDATNSQDDPKPDCGNNSTEKSVWYSYTATQTTRLEANTFESGYDTIVSVWIGSPGMFSQVACNDDVNGVHSRAFFDANLGTTYHIMVSSYSGRGGTLSLSLLPAPDQLELDVSIEDVGYTTAESGKAVIVGEITCSSPAALYIYVEVAQRRGGDRVTGGGSQEIDCTGSERWLVTATGRSPFEAGVSGVDVHVNSEEGAEAFTSKSVPLRSCTIIGTLKDDKIRGTDKNDRICSLAGNDQIFGGLGDDKLRGHDGDDVVVGGSGNDLLTGGYGNDAVSGQSGNDVLYGDHGDDDLDGGPGSDSCQGESGQNRFRSCERKF